MTSPKRNADIAAAFEFVPPPQSELNPGDLLPMPSLEAPAEFDLESALAMLTQMRVAIETAPDLRSQRQAAAWSNSLRELIEKIDAGSTLVNAAIATTLVAERRAGLSLSALPRTGHRHDGPRSPYQTTLDAIGLQPRVARYWQQVAAVPEDIFASYVEPALEGAVSGRTPDDMVSRRALLRVAKELVVDADAPVESPDVTILRDAAERALGSLEVDTDNADGAPDWAGTVWLDASHGEPADTDRVATALMAAWTDERLDSALIRVPLRPGAPWWSLLAGFPVCLLFPQATGLRSATAGAVFALGVDPARFGAAFAGLGWAYHSVITD